MSSSSKILDHFQNTILFRSNGDDNEIQTG